ncbi:hypothetical protein GRI58_03610 [Porphyrobacter algicida]|uniref:Uncharacterized protein n=1 Tax=Qipengyuania algicida TaxID=1836209 RepID=A0A845ALL2_9SPHN|nr:hypothetical protein [Qipengyuania algicida]MXP27908.1 hypothetical protein [Qipengyuania algicida]
MSDWQTAFDAFELAKHDISDEVLGEDYADAELNFYVDNYDLAVRRLLLTSAPNWPSFIQKLEVFREDEAYQRMGGSSLFDVLIADARRLAGEPDGSQFVKPVRN